MSINFGSFYQMTMSNDENEKENTLKILIEELLDNKKVTLKDFINFDEVYNGLSDIQKENFKIFMKKYEAQLLSKLS